MDSCHIFNFLFGTRKATSELRKCFSGATASQTRAKDGRSITGSTKNPDGLLDSGPLVQQKKSEPQQDAQQRYKTPNSSPFKQIQLKLVNLAAGGSESSVLSSSQVAQSATSASSCLRTKHDDAIIVSQEHAGQRCSQFDAVDRSDRTISHDKPQVVVTAGAHTTTAGFPCGIFEAQLVRLDEDEANVQRDDEKMGQKELEASKNRIRTPLKVIVENPANKLDNVDDELNKEDVEANEPRINVYNNPLIAARHQYEQATTGRIEQVPPKASRATDSNDDDRMNKSERVRSLVQSFEISATRRVNGQATTNQSPLHGVDGGSLTRRLSKPPDTPPKSNRAKCLNLQLTLRKPTKVSVLFQDETFLTKHFFNHLAPIDRCAAAQVCRRWRNILYADKNYWKDLVGVIDCTQLRREHLVECILNTLQSARLKHQQHNQQLLQRVSAQHGATGAYQSQHGNHQQQYNHHNNSQGHHHRQEHQTGTGGDLYDLSELDKDEIWRIQELCNRYTMRGFSNGLNGTLGHAGNQTQSQLNRTSATSVSSTASQNDQNDTTTNITQQMTSTTSGIANSKSSSSQISSSTLSSISISSLLSPLSESSRVDSIREKLYTALDERGFDSICLFGATDEDIEDLASKTRPNGAQKQIKVGRLSNCSISDRGLEVFASTFGQTEELELTGCNEITNAIDLRGLRQLRRLIITDCINIADGLAQRLIDIFHQLEVFVLQAYHLTDAFLEFISLNSDTSRLKRLELPNCKEITNDSALTIAKHFQSVETLSISGSTKINDDGVEILAEHMKSASSLDLGWLKIGDLSLECIACDLRQLRELVLDRNVHITDLGLGYLTSMANLTLLYVRWCSQLTDKSLKSISNMRSLTRVSLAGLHQITARGILSLIDLQQLEELELTNCPAVTCELQQFLSTKMPDCNIIY